MVPYHDLKNHHRGPATPPDSLACIPNLIKERICAVIVAYHPDQEHLSALLAQCLDQCDGVILVNNGVSMDLSTFGAGSLYVVDTGTNIGLAAAQNLGVRWAAKHSFTFVWFIDQDSFPSAGLVATLRQEYLRLESAGKMPAAVGPALVDNRDGVITPFVRFHYWGVERRFPDLHQGSVKCDFLISSGLFTSVSRFISIGYWEEDLFIDNVDLEWSFRARSLGYHCYGIGMAKMDHSLGDSVIRFHFFWKKMTIHMHSPTRQYYITRNRILLYRRGYVPLSWKVHDIPRALIKSVFLSLVSTPRWCNLNNILRGAWDGLRGRCSGVMVKNFQVTQNSVVHLDFFSLSSPSSHLGSNIQQVVSEDGKLEGTEKDLSL